MWSTCLWKGWRSIREFPSRTVAKEFFIHQLKEEKKSRAMSDEKQTKRKRIFSGIQPSGDIHIGNYLGAIQHWVKLQDSYDCIYCVVDLHAITVPQDPNELQRGINEVAGILIAAGIEPAQTVVFTQSQITAHAELAWILNCYTPFGWMQRMTQFKEKSEQGRENVSVGLFDYPALMAADILLYDTNYVPVGEDQKQHLEFTRDLAQRFNSQYGDTFVLPEPLIPDIGARIMGLDEPTKKMSKSEGKKGHALFLLDSPDDIKGKIKRATTDSLKEIRFDESRPGIFNLLGIYEQFSTLSRDEIEARFEGKGYAQFKEELAEVVIEGLKPLQTRFKELTDDPNYIPTVMKEAAERIRPTAERVLGDVKRKIGLPKSI